MEASKNRFSFTGYEWDPELGLFNAKARYFDPQIGRFTSQDSFLGQIDDPPSLHRYFYANDNPTRFIDTTGHAGIDTVKNAGRAVVDFGAGAIVAYTADVIPGLDRHRPDAYNRASAAGQRVGDVVALVQSSYEIAAGITAITGGAGGEGLLAVIPGTQPAAVAAAPVAGGLIAAGALAVGHGGYTAMTAKKHLDSGTRSETDSVPRVRKESPSGDDATPQPGQKAETGSQPTLEPAVNQEPKSGVYEIRGKVEGKKKSYVGSGFDTEERPKSTRHPARQILSEGEDVTVTHRPVDVSDAATRQEAQRILRTNEQLSLNEVRAEGGENINKINARAPKKFERDLPKYGDRRQPPKVKPVKPQDPNQN